VWVVAVSVGVEASVSLNYRKLKIDLQCQCIDILILISFLPESKPRHETTLSPYALGAYTKLTLLLQQVINKPSKQR